MLIRGFSRIACGVVVAAWAGVSACAPALADDTPRPASKAEIEKIVHDYLLNNPEIVIEAVKAYRDREKKAQAAAVRKAVKERRAELQRDPGSPTSGTAGADVVVVEFFDYRCGVCRRVHPIVTELTRTDKKIRRVYKEWPILGPDSLYAARAALASRRQGKYLEFHKAMMENRVPVTRASVMTIAEKHGIDTEKLRKDMKDPEIAAILQRNFKLAEALKLTGTPTFVIGDEVVRGGRDLQTLRALIDRQRKSG